MEIGSRLVAARDWGGRMGVTVKGTKFLFKRMKVFQD